MTNSDNSDNFTDSANSAIIPDLPPNPGEQPDAIPKPGSPVSLAEVAVLGGAIPPPDLASLELLGVMRDLLLQFQINYPDSLPNSLVRTDPDSGFPIWGPCTRCGHTWRGQNHNRTPSLCARCHSKGWNKQPIRLDTARFPSDVPRPEWKKPQRKRTEGKVRKRRKVTFVPAEPADPAEVVFYPAPPIPAPTGIMSLAPLVTASTASPVGLRPPPRMEDVVVPRPPTPPAAPAITEQQAAEAYAESYVEEMMNKPAAAPPEEPPAPPAAPSVLTAAQPTFILRTPQVVNIPLDKPIEMHVEPPLTIEDTYKITNEAAAEELRELDKIDLATASRNEVADYIRAQQPTDAEKVVDFISQTAAPSFSDPAKLDAFFKGGGASEEAKAAFFADADIDLTPRIRAVDDPPTAAVVQAASTTPAPANTAAAPQIVNQSALDKILSKLEDK